MRAPRASLALLTTVGVYALANAPSRADVPPPPSARTLVEHAIAFDAPLRATFATGLAWSIDPNGAFEHDGAFSIAFGSSAASKLDLAYRGAHLGLSRVGASAVAATVDGSRATFAGAWPSADVVATTNGHRYEEAIVLRDAKAPSTFSYALTLPNGGTAAIEADGALSIYDASHRGVFRIPRAYAIDAVGVRRDATMTLDGRTLSIALERAGLSYPIVVDPAVEKFVWQDVTPSPAPRGPTAAAYDAAHAQTVVFGGDFADAEGTGSLAADTALWNGTKWSRVSPAKSPSRRTGHTMAYDAKRNKVVLFGGATFSQGNAATDETWEWDGTNWAIACAGCDPAPHARRYHAMAYDADDAVTVLFGGTSNTTEFGDTWTYDGTKWALVATPTALVAREKVSMAYDANRKKIVLFGGEHPDAADPTKNPATVFGDTWEWTSAGGWVNPSTTAPNGAARYGALLAYDTTSKQVVMYGGAKADGTTLTDTLAWNGSSWTPITTTTANPGPRVLGALVSDDANHALTLFGGATSCNNVTASGVPDCSGVTGDVWAEKAGAWAVAFTAGIPARVYASAAFHEKRGVMAVFGGMNTSRLATSDGGLLGNGYLDGTFLWNGTSWAADASPTVPPHRAWAAMDYDDAGTRLVLAGGFRFAQSGLSFSGGQSDAWAWDGTWSEIGDLPAARVAPAMAWDRNHATGVLFGGGDFNVNILGLTATSTGQATTFDLTGTTWASVSPSASAPGRLFHAMTYDRAKQVSLVFGGYPTGTATLSAVTFTPATADLWSWDGAGTDPWTALCTTSPCTTAQPTPRGFARLSYDADRKRAILFGGLDATSGAPLGETWEWDGATWTLVSTAGPARYGHVQAFDSARGATVVTTGVDASGALLGDVWEYFSDGAACTGASDCETGFCVDGVCCNVACAGQCEACDVAGSEGTCSVVTGAPHGSRTSCGGTDACKPIACDGSSRTTCTSSLAGPDTICSAAACTASTESPEKRCDGAGNCAGAAPKQCDPFACDATACKTACTVDGDCAHGFRCNPSSGKCEAGGVCLDDHTSKSSDTGATQDCSPFKCVPASGACGITCATSDDCASGFTCDPTSKTCTGNGGGSGSSGGCGCDVAGGDRTTWAFGAIALGAIAVSVRRRRRCGR